MVSLQKRQKHPKLNLVSKEKRIYISSISTRNRKKLKYLVSQHENILHLITKKKNIMYLIMLNKQKSKNRSKKINKS